MKSCSARSSHLRQTSSLPSCSVKEWEAFSVLTLSCGGVAQTCHDDRVVELKEQLVVEEEVDGERQEGKVKEEGRDRVKENAPWMVWRWL